MKIINDYNEVFYELDTLFSLITEVWEQLDDGMADRIDRQFERINKAMDQLYSTIEDSVIPSREEYDEGR